MSPIMAKKKPGRPKAEEARIAFQVRLPRPLNAAIEKLADRARRSKNVEIEIAIEEYCTRMGLWPPPEEDE